MNPPADGGLQAAEQPFHQVAQHEVIIRHEAVCLPGFGESGGPVRQLPAVSRGVVFAVHIVYDVRGAAGFEGTQDIAVAYVACRQGVVAPADIGDQVIEYLLFILRCRQSHVEGDGVCRLAVAVIGAGGRIPEGPVEGFFDPGGQFPVFARIVGFA